MKRTVIFKDAEGNKVVYNAEIRTGKDDKLTFAASGEYCGSLGQCFDRVRPRTDAQKQLIDLWQKYHLNDMKAGTERQGKYVAGLSYDDACRKLASIERATEKESFLNYDAIIDDLRKYREEIRIIDDWFKKASCSADDIDNAEYYKKTRAHYEVMFLEADRSLKSSLLYDEDSRNPDELYKYGSGWLYRSLPENFEDTLNDLIDQIEEEEENEKERPVNENDIDLFSDFDDSECAFALALMFGLAVNEIEDIQENGDNSWTVQGIDYLAGDDSDMDDKWDEELESYLDECVLPDVPENVRNYFDSEAWKRDARYDGRGHALNRYNGGEEEQTVNGTTYYAYRQ